MIKFDIFNRLSGEVQFTAEIECEDGSPRKIKLGLAIKKALEVKADLRSADLYGADLRSADLYGANLRSANLRSADLRSANLYGADLRSADLYGADLRSANLRSADLRSANLRSADLRSADLYGANLDSKTKLPAFQIPQEGELIVFKKTSAGVVKLRIPAEAKRTATPIGRKCRAEFVEVIEAPDDAWDNHSRTIQYISGQIVRPDSYDPNPSVECTNGIHFFLTREEAEEY